MDELEQLASEYGLNYDPNRQEVSKYTDTHQIIIKPNPPRGYYYSIKSGNFDPYVDMGYGSKIGKSGNTSNIEDIKIILNKYMPISEKKLTKPEKKEKEKIVKGLKGQKKDFAKRYGKKDAEAVMYATATKLAKKIKESDKQKVEEAVAKYFEAKTEKYNDNPALKGKQKTALPDELQAAIIKKQGGKVEEEAMLFTNDFAKQDQVNYIDDEGRMAKQQLYKIKKYAQELCDMLDDNTQLEGWVQAKITKAEEAIGAVKHYIEYEMFRKQQG
jgi:hypothetical protein